jgi:HEPN domain-containing protein
VQRELGRLTKDEPRFDLELRALLGRNYDLKAIADYQTDPGSEVTVGQARQAIATAERFVACVEALLA